jgi:hypothetical protein
MMKNIYFFNKSSVYEGMSLFPQKIFSFSSSSKFLIFFAGLTPFWFRFMLYSPMMVKPRHIPGPALSLPSSYETIQPFLSDEFRERAGELEYLLTRANCQLSETEIKNLAEQAVNIRHAKVLNVLSKIYPEFLKKDFIFQLLVTHGDAYLIHNLLLLESHELSCTLNGIVSKDPQSLRSLLNIMYIEDISGFFSRITPSQKAEFIVHNGEFHQDGRLIHGVVSLPAANVPPKIILHVDEQEHGQDHELDLVIHHAKHHFPSVEIAIETTPIISKYFVP